VFSISENVNENTIEVYIARIRKLINTSSVIIKTLRGIGYKLEKKNETSF
jgi:two-component system response regulator TctD